MKKYLLLLILFFLPLLGGVIYQKNDEEEIKSVINQYFKVRYKILSELDIGQYKGALPKEEEELLEYKVIYRKIQPIDFRFTDYEIEIKFIKIDINDNFANVVVEENSKIKFNCISNLYSELRSLSHEMKLEKKNSKWVIKEDKYYDDLRDLLYVRGEVGDIESYINSWKVDSEVRKKRLKGGEELRGIKEYKEREEDGTRALGKYKMYKYNRLSAVEYGEEYALNMNTSYSNYEDYGGDCTNYVSQCIRAGGIPFDNVGEEKWFWYSDSKRTPSWTSAKLLREYLLNNNGSYDKFGIKASESTFEDMNLGDIVQFKEPTHSMFIVGYLSYKEGSWEDKYDLLISQHSVSERGRLLNYPLSLKEREMFYIKIEDYYK